MENISQKFSEGLKRARGDRSQAEFARFLGIEHQATYQRYEAGRVPDGEVLHQIATRIGVTMEHLLTGLPAQGAPKEGLLVVGNTGFSLSVDVGGETVELEATLAELAASLPRAVRVAKKVLLGNVFQWHWN